MSLSEWDLKHLSKSEQKEIEFYKKQWDADPSNRDVIHKITEEIRSRYGYSGGSDGSQYISSNKNNKEVDDEPRKPKAPKIDRYESPYADQINDIMDQMQNQKPYKSPYEDLINKSMSDLINRPKFSYNPEEDTAYQAFLQRATRAGEQAYADNLGGLSAMTGGRANSWAGTVASQARNQYTLQAQEAVVQFEDRAYSRYQNETNDMYNLLGALNSQDATAYARYRDKIGDTKDLADMVFRLEDRDFEQFKYQSEQQWKVFDAEYQAYNDSLTLKQNKIAEAIDRTNLQGFVNNQDSITLGVPSGTLSQSARERAEQMEDYILKQQRDIEQFRKEKQISHEFDLKLLNSRESYSASSGGSYSGGTSGIGSFAPSSNEIKAVNTEYDDFNKWISSDNFKRMTVGKQYQEIQAYQEQVISSANNRLFGENSNEVGALILNKINAHPTVAQLSNDYKKALAKVQGNKTVLSGPRGGTYAE